MSDMSGVTSPVSLALRVAEARTKDVGRGLVRLDPQDLARLGVAIGDVVQIRGQRTTVARALPAYAEQRGQSLVQMDGVLRANAQVGLDEQVTIQRADVPQARAVVLAASEAMQGASSSAGYYLARLLDGMPVVVGDRVRATLFGTRPQTFEVVETSPPQAVVIGAATTIRFANQTAVSRQNAVTYEDIGGLRREIRRIREIIELPLRYPEIFDRLGIDPPKGVLLHGPPGCGKTLIARAVAQETSAHFILVNGPEIMNQWLGSSEGNLRKIFEEARRRAPAIIFLDEIDAIAPKRDQISGEHQTERRLVAQLLTLMDGLEARGNVIVIAATNIPNTLDPALRRPGRFDRELAIRVPDKDGRREILDIYTRGMPLAPDVDLERLSVVTHGFVGADLEALGREAAMNALRRLMPEIDFAQVSIPYPKLARLHVTADDFNAALAEIEPSALREVFTEVPDVRWEDIGGLDDVKQVVIEAVDWPLRHKELFTQVGVRPAKGVLLHGPPGTGKTLVAKAVARQSEANFIAVNGPQLLSMWVGESERAVREVFRKARQAAPCIIFFDEIDALAPRREGFEHAASERVVSQLLTEMDGIGPLEGVVVLAATNRPDRVDPALLRPGRFDVLIELAPPHLQSRQTILGVHTRNMPLAPDVDLAALAEACEGFVGADIAELCRRAALLAIRQRVRTDDADPLDSARNLRVHQRHFEHALRELSRQLDDHPHT